MDELDRLRGLLDDAPAPDPGRKAAARNELLAMARAEEEAHAEADAADTEVGVGTIGTLRRLLTGGSPWPRLAAAAALLLVVGVGAVLIGPFDPAHEEAPVVGPDPDAPPASEEVPADETPQDGPVAFARTCEDPDGHYTVDYPDEWHANQRCGAFAAEPVEGWNDAVGGAALGAIDITVEPVAFEDAIDPGGHAEELEGGRTTVDGRDAYRGHRASTGDAGLDEGTEYYIYYVDLGDHTLIARTRDPGDGTFEERREVLDRMMETISVHDAG